MRPILHVAPQWNALHPDFQCIFAEAYLSLIENYSHGSWTQIFSLVLVTSIYGSSGYHLSSYCSGRICLLSIILDIFLVSKYIQPSWGVAIYADFASCTSVIQYGDLWSLPPWHICPQVECPRLNIWLVLVDIQLAADHSVCQCNCHLRWQLMIWPMCLKWCGVCVCISAPPVDDNMPLQSHQCQASLPCEYSLAHNSILEWNLLPCNFIRGS